MNNIERLSTVRGFLLDMDGTFYLSDRLLEGALPFIDLLRAQKKTFLFLTNNSSKHRRQYAEKISRLGLAIPEEAVLTSREATALYLKERYPGAKIFLVGTPALEEEFSIHGIRLVEKDPQFLGLGFDTTLTYQKLWALCDFVRAGIPYAAASRLTGIREESYAEGREDIRAADRVFIANEDSITIAVIDPVSNTVERTINLTSFDDDPRPPFRFVTGGLAPTHAAMIHKPLYHGCIDAHGVVPSPDGRMLATSGRGSSNVYLIDSVHKKVVGNVVNPFASPTTNAERISGGILVGREPHEPTFTRNGRELWVAVRGEDRIAILDVERAVRQSAGPDAQAILKYVGTINGPAQVWFNASGTIAYVVSQKV